ncbi:hypothetical protein Sjap_000445 [Stephania japonica]|uniref:Uncharacterized protein n=1 Tax=Stephania japonica TaxID=461633 RepID=A0AAP0PSG0_9MAGN
MSECFDGGFRMRLSLPHVVLMETDPHRCSQIVMALTFLSNEYHCALIKIKIKCI